MEYQNAFESFAATNPSTVDLYACRACLATDIKLFDIQECDLAETFETVTGFSVPPDVRYPQHLCPHCFMLLQKFSSFKQRCKRSLEILETVSMLISPLTTDYVRLIDRNAEGLSLPLAMHEKKIEVISIDAPPPLPPPPLPRRVFQSRSRPERPRKYQPVRKIFEMENEEYIHTFFKHKEIPVNTKALEDNPFAVPGAKVFRSAAVGFAAPPSGHEPPSPQEPGSSRRRWRKDGATISKPGPRDPDGYPGCVAAIRHGLRLRGGPTTGSALMLSRLSPTTLQIYNQVYKQWWRFCAVNELDPYKHDEASLVKFFTEKFDRGLKVNSARAQRCALTILLGKDINHDLNLVSLFRATSANRPRQRNHLSWDPADALNFLAYWFPHEELPLDRISKKLVTLLALVTDHGTGSLSRLKLEDVSIEPDGAIIAASETHRAHWLPYCREEPNICPVQCLVDYLRMSERVRPEGSQNLLINVKAPYGGAAAQTVSRWVHRTLVMCRVDMKVFMAPDGREILSQYKSECISLDVLRKQAVCSPRAEKFLLMYRKNGDE